MLCTCDEGAVEREADVTGFQELDDFVFLTLVFEGELVLVVEGRLGVLVDVEVDFVADFGHHVELDVLVKNEFVVAFASFGHRFVVAEVVLEAKGEVDGTLGTDVDGVAPEDGLKGFAADEHGWDDGVAVGGRTRVLAAAFFPVFLYALTVLIFKVFALCEGGGRVVIELADATFEGVLSSYWVVDDFGLEVVGVAEVERRLVVEVPKWVARVDGDGVDDFGRVGLDDIRVGVENIVVACSSQTKGW